MNEGYLFEQLLRDLTDGLRALWRGRWVSALAVTSLAVGIAANTTICSIVQAIEFPRLHALPPARQRPAPWIRRHGNSP